MVERETLLQQGQEDLVNGIQRLAEWSLTQPKDRLLELMTAIGQIASAANEFSLQTTIDPAITTPDIAVQAVHVDTPEQTRPHIYIPLDKVLASLPAEAVVATVEEPVVVETVAEESEGLIVTFEEEPPALPPQIQEEDPLLQCVAPMYKPALTFLLDNRGRIIQPRELIKLMPGPTEVARKARLRKFVEAVHQSELSPFMHQKGERGGRLYWFGDLQPTTEPIQKAPNIIQPEQPIQSEHEALKVTLTNWGLTFSQNGKRTVELDGKPLKCREVTAEALLLLSQHPDGLSFMNLREQFEGLGRQLDVNFLSGVLSEIKQVLGDKAERKWVNTVLEADGEKYRFLHLVGAKPLEETPNFLGRILPRHPPAIRER